MKTRIPPWKCPECGRRFMHRNQEHSCVRLDPDEHFVGKNPRVRGIYDRLLQGVREFGDVDVSTVKIGVMLKATSTFAAVKPKESWIDLEFILDEEITQFPVHKTVRYTEGRWAHFVRLEHPKDVSKKLLGWLRRSHRLVSAS